MAAVAALAIPSCSSDDDGDDAAEAIPCEVQQVLQAKCQRCHGDPVEEGAPFSLVTLEDLKRDTASGPVYERVLRALETEYMPPDFLTLDPPVQELTDDELDVLLEWVEAGAPAENAGACQ